MRRFVDKNRCKKRQKVNGWEHQIKVTYLKEWDLYFTQPNLLKFIILRGVENDNKIIFLLW